MWKKIFCILFYTAGNKIFSALETYAFTSFYLRCFFKIYFTNNLVSLLFSSLTFSVRMVYCIFLCPMSLCFSVFSIHYPLILLFLCFRGWDRAVESQWEWVKVTLQSTAKTTVIACCPPRPTRVVLGKSSRGTRDTAFYMQERKKKESTVWAEMGEKLAKW